MNSEVCHVGFTATDGDRLRVNIAMTFLNSVGYSTSHWRVLEHDTLDLNNFGRVDQGRDFLAETHRYKVVLLHFLYRPSNFGNMLLPELRTSAQHSWSGWRERLRLTQADYIFPFGGATEISGSFISLLDGYQLYGPTREIAFRSSGFDTEEDFWVYASDSVTQPKASDKLKHYQPFQRKYEKLDRL